MSPATVVSSGEKFYSSSLLSLVVHDAADTQSCRFIEKTFDTRVLCKSFFLAVQFALNWAA